MKKIVYYILTTLMRREWLIRLLTNQQEKTLLSFKDQGYLFDIGWTNSMATHKVVDRFDKPLPWVSYPFIHFITPRLNKNIQLFEYGSGNSTLFYAERVATVHSVEHEKEWYEKVKENIPNNAQLFFCELSPNGDYSKYASKQQQKFDVIIVDGRDRVNCCLNSIDALKPEGVMILDDSEREKYSPAIQFLHTNGFKSIDFWGTAPTVNYLKCTTIFYRENNCLGL